MPVLHLLGTGAALSDPHRTTTMLAISSEASPKNTLVVDCGGDAIRRLQACGEPIGEVEGLIVTHADMDHTSGFPLFMKKIQLSGRKRPMPVCGIEPAEAQAKRLWDAFKPADENWSGHPPIDWRTIPYEDEASVWNRFPWTVTAAPVDHRNTPNVGLRFEHASSEGVLTYSCDTTPTSSVVDLAQGADVLVHEANGIGGGHSTAAGAAKVAAEAEVNRLLLVHLPPGSKRKSLRKARRIFPHVSLGREMGTYQW